MVGPNCTTHYTCSDVKTLFVPFVDESKWRIEVRAFLYLVALIWIFVAILIISDIFVSSIEHITNSVKTITIFDPESGRDVLIEVNIWNDTVANLTLMAIGTSSPEILLSIIEIISNTFESGDLGPSTIIGSASFNLFVTWAVCVSVIGPEGRRIKQFAVFCYTLTFSVFAHLWLVIILEWSTPDFVDLWEAVLTFLFFFILVVIAYMIDKRFGCKRPDEGDPDTEKGVALEAGPIAEEEVDVFLKQIGKDPSLTEDDLKQLVLKKFSERMPKSRAWYRMNATRGLTGGHKLEVQLSDKLQQKLSNLDAGEGAFGNLEGATSVISLRAMNAMSENNKYSVVEFTSAGIAVLESDQRARLGIRRYGNLALRAAVKLETVDGTATKDDDYVPFKKTIVFEKEETYQYIDVEIIDDDEWEPDENFFVKMSLEKGHDLVKLGSISINQITIINDDEPGTFEFENASYLFKESCQKACIPVRRVNGADGVATVSWKTVDATAKAGISYECGLGDLSFNHGEIEKTLEIQIIDIQSQEKDEHFKLELTGCSQGAKLGKISSTIITIVSDDEYTSLVSRLAHAANIELENIRVDRHSYAEQFIEAMSVNGGDAENAKAGDYIMHFITFLWKVLFAVVPPPHLLGGWLCFFVALGVLGILTALVIDLASVFGCLVGLKDSVTAITFVAIGSSLPDLFASKQAAMNDDTADNAIGNVMGSNSVNVFLGLGIPWSMAAIYHTAKGGSFQVKAGDLVFTVIIFTVCCLVATALLIVRRFVKVFGNCELGGNRPLKYMCAAIFFLIWFFYIVLSSLRSYEIIKTDF